MRKTVLLLALGLAACAENSAGDVLRHSAGGVTSAQVMQYDGSWVVTETNGVPAAVPAGTILRRADQRCDFFGKFLWDETAFPECKLGEGEKPKNGYIVRKGAE